MRHAGPPGEHPLRSRRMTGGLAFLNANLYPYGGLLPCRTGLGRSLVGYRCLQVDPSTCPVPNVDLSFGVLEPPQLSGLSHQWIGMALDERLGVLSDDSCWLSEWIDICW